MGLQRDTYVVTVADLEGELREHTAVITHQDMLRGEQALLDANGAKLQQALALTTAWCWASLMRQGDYSGPWQQFRDADCQAVEPGEPVDVDPTTRATPVT